MFAIFSGGKESTVKECNNRNSWLAEEKALIQCVILINGMVAFMFFQSHFSTHVRKKGTHVDVDICSIPP